MNKSAASLERKIPGGTVHIDFQLLFLLSQERFLYYVVAMLQNAHTVPNSASMKVIPCSSATLKYSVRAIFSLFHSFESVSFLVFGAKSCLSELQECLEAHRL